jgi:DNA mismatch endonuclease (patch repair protein)
LKLTGGDIVVRPDIVFTRRRVAVFVDGCFWHGCPEHGELPVANRAFWRGKLERNALRDKRVDAALSAAGWRVVRVWEHERPADAADVIAELLTPTPSTTDNPHSP